MKTIITEAQAYTMFDETLDECETGAKIFNMDFPPSFVLKACDPVAYRCCFLDYLDSLEEDYEIEYKD
jgi:hypothetical protein